MGLTPEHPHVVHQGDLDTAATQVGEDPLSTRQVDPVRHRQMDQSSLFGSGDHFQVDAGLFQDPPNQLEPVTGFPDGAGGHCPEGLELQFVDLLPEGDEGLNCSFHGRFGQLPRQEDLMAQADRDPLVVEDLELVRTGELSGDEPDGIGPGIHAPDPEWKIPPPGHSRILLLRAFFVPLPHHRVLRRSENDPVRDLRSSAETRGRSSTPQTILYPPDTPRWR